MNHFKSNFGRKISKQAIKSNLLAATVAAVSFDYD